MSTTRRRRWGPPWCAPKTLLPKKGGSGGGPSPGVGASSDPASPFPLTTPTSPSRTSSSSMAARPHADDEANPYGQMDPHLLAQLLAPPLPPPVHNTLLPLSGAGGRGGKPQPPPLPLPSPRASTARA